MRKIVVGIGALVALAIYFIPKKGNDDSQRMFSRELGYGIWDDLKVIQKNVSLEDLIEGMRAREAGKDLSQIATNDSDFEKLRIDLQRDFHEKKMKERLTKAQDVLSKVSKEPDTVTLEKGLLYYKVLAPGEGGWEVEPETSASFHYIVSNADNQEFINTYQEGQPKQVNLLRVIPGFAKGVVGMKIGEKRRLYVHPDLGYRQSSCVVPAQTLLIIDVELLP